MGLAHSRKSEQFSGEVIWNKVTNRKQINFSYPKFLQHFLNVKTSVSDPLVIRVSVSKPKRTNQQNRYWWGVYLPLISEETGEEDVEALHELFKGLFLTQTIKEVMGHKVRIKKSTTDLSVNEFCEFILSVEKYTGIEAPPPENYSLTPLIRPLTPVLKEKIIT